MSDFTRKTHIVRVPVPDSDPGDPSEYIDVEVLDAISFRIANNEEVILNMPAKGATPYIVDKTGGEHQKEGGKSSTQRSHMKRITSGDNALDVEVLDCWAARGPNNSEWILDMQPGADGSTDFNISDGSGDSKSTRRVHTEIVTAPSGKTKSEAADSYVTSVRSDNIAFRTLNNREVILSLPSCDDTHAQGVNFGRASTHTTPEGYDPNDDSDNAVKPPTLKESGDQHNYINFVDDGNGGFKAPFTKDEKIEMGPLWWVRKVKGGNVLVISASRPLNGGEPGFTNFVLSDGVKLVSHIWYPSPGHSDIIEAVMLKVPKTGTNTVSFDTGLTGDQYSDAPNPFPTVFSAAFYNSTAKSMVWFDSRVGKPSASNMGDISRAAPGDQSGLTIEDAGTDELGVNIVYVDASAISYDDFTKRTKKSKLLSKFYDSSSPDNPLNLTNVVWAAGVKTQGTVTVTQTGNDVSVSLAAT